MAVQGHNKVIDLVKIERPHGTTL